MGDGHVSAGAAYDAIGRGYSRQRRPDPRIADRLTAALGGAQSVVNVGAGAGSYEPTDRVVVAVEPSARWRIQLGASLHYSRDQAGSH